MLRALLALLLLANLVFFGWAQGWFAPAWPAPRAGEHEPARLAAQVAPERVVVLAPAAASAALAAQREAQCLQSRSADETQGSALSVPSSVPSPLPTASLAGSDLKPCAVVP